MYPELFGEGDGETNEERKHFGAKWGSYQELCTLAESNVSRIIEGTKDKPINSETPVSEYPLHGCLMYLSYTIDKANYENRQIKKGFKK